MTSGQHRLLGVVLCGGRSSRMGRDKTSILHPSGKTFLQLAVERAQDVCDAVCVSTSPGQSTLDLRGIPHIEDTKSHQGPIGGLVKCLEYARLNQFAGCLITPVDMPDLTVDDLRGLRDCWNESPLLLACSVNADSERLEPLVAIYPVGMEQAIRAAAASDDRSLQRFLQRECPKLVYLSAAATRNVNTPADL